jgi:hypothetical protein
MSDPWLKFYPSDWRADPALRMCSIAARGLWMEMLCIMHEAAPRGCLLVNGQPVSDRQLASLCGCSDREIKTLLRELKSAGVCSEDNGVVYSRRMKADTEKAARDKANGKRGGNPRVIQGVNPPANPPDNGEDKAQIPEARNQNKKNGAAAPILDPQAALFARGKEVLGPSASGMVAKLLKTKGGIVPHARAVLEQASTKHNPTQYVARCIHGQEEREQTVGRVNVAI